MRPVNDPLLRWRQPTEQEKLWIAEKWGYAEKENAFPLKGNFLRYLGIFLIVVGVASTLRETPNIAGTIVTLVIAVLCVFFAGKFRYANRLHKQRAAAFEQGEYLLADAYSAEIRKGENIGFNTGRVSVRLPSGGYLKDLRMPYACAEPLIRQKIHTVHLLLIQVPGDEEILTLPVQQ